MHERLLGEFAICTGRIPNELHGSKAPTRWTCEMHERLLGEFAICTGQGARQLKCIAKINVHCDPEKVHAN
ncbi:hypothetical protein CDL15_Pgr006191 [Punica granatum]|uniref:Uncharacterized protein n=1 Tax=Punica granatum TaxID=22663 RepID=A0A218XQK7_PUNGR|nr:hypothetical protein CDL15_Pgr006191 [Punica granatum]